MLEKNVRYAHVSHIFLEIQVTCLLSFKSLALTVLEYTCLQTSKTQNRPLFGPGDKTV
ncbi:hypothetical protein WDU94_007598 [Cyamophila willieti]